VGVDLVDPTEDLGLLEEYGVDPRLGDMIEDRARETLGDRYVDLWVAEDQMGFVLGVLGKTRNDESLSEGWNTIARLEVADCPVGRAALDNAVSTLAAEAPEGWVYVGPDYINGMVSLGVLEDQMTLAVSQVEAVDGFRAVPAGTRAPSLAAGEILVEVEVTEPIIPSEPLNPTESNTTGALRAGKQIRLTTSGCTSGAWVKKAGANYMLTAGHCGNVNHNVWYNDYSDTITIGKVDVSNWGSGTANVPITGDIASFSLKSDVNVKASVFVTSSSAENITGWARPRVNSVACMRGAASNAQSCAKITQLNFTTPTNYCSLVTGQCRIVQGLAMAGYPTIGGDSGGPVYYRGPTGVVMLGINSGYVGKMAVFTPMNTALVATGSKLVRAPGLGVPSVTSGLSLPFAQIAISPDFTGDQYGEVIGLDGNGNLVAYQGKPGFSLGSPPGLMDVGLAGSRILMPGDWDGDGIADVLSIDATGVMYYQQGRGGGGLGAKIQSSQGWKNYKVMAAGDFNSDGIQDLLAVNSAGALWLYPGNGSGGVKSRIQVGGSLAWGSHTLVGGRDFDGDGKADLLTVHTNGTMYFYKGNGNGTVKAAQAIGTGWNNYTAVGGADLDGDGKADVIAIHNQYRTLHFYRANGSGGFYTPAKQIGTNW